MGSISTATMGVEGGCDSTNDILCFSSNVVMYNGCDIDNVLLVRSRLRLIPRKVGGSNTTVILYSCPISARN